MEMEFEIIHNDDRPDMVIFKLGTVKGRHEMPVKNFIFDQSITDFRIPMIELHVHQYLEQLLEAYRAKYTPELNYSKLRQHYNFRIDLYLTGLTSVTTSVIKVLAKGHGHLGGNGIGLNVYHYDPILNDYRGQLIF